MNYRFLQLKDCLSMITNGFVVKQSRDSNKAGGYPFTRIETLSNGKFNRDRMGYADIYELDGLESYILDNEDILISHINSRRFLGRSVLYKKEKDEVILHGMNVLRVKTNSTVLNPVYANYFFQTSYYKNCIDNIRKDAINQSSFSIGDFQNLVIPVPDIDYQDKVATVLSSLDAKISLNQAINRNLEALAKQLYDYWFVQFDFPDENGKPYKSSGGKMVWNEVLKREIPVGWDVKKIGEILGKVKNTPRLVTDEYLQEGKYPIIDQTRDVYYAGFTNREDAVSSQFPTVVFGDHSCAVKYVNFPFVRGADGTQVMLPNDTRLSVEYLYFFVQNVKISEGYARHYSFLKESPIILPKQEIADLFKNAVSKWFKMITHNRIEITALTRQRDELLPLLMNGQVEVGNKKK